MDFINQYISLPVYGLIVNKDRHFYQIKSPTYKNELINISKDIIENSAKFSTEFNSTEKVNKHELAEKLVFSNGTVFTVEFEKQDKSVRKLIGYLSSTDTLLGYSTVVDLELLTKDDKSNNKRTVYHNKLLSLIINNIKYVTK